VLDGLGRPVALSGDHRTQRRAVADVAVLGSGARNQVVLRRHVLGLVPATRRAVGGAFLLSCRSENTRRAYARDIRSFYAWCAELGVEPLAIRRAHVDAYARHLEHPPTGKPAAQSTIARKLSTLSGLYGYAVAEQVLERSPVAAVKRPKLGDDSQSTGLDRDELRRLLAVAEADGLRSQALVTLLALNGLRVDEALSRDVEHLDVERGHRVLRLRRKGGARAAAVLSPPRVRALDAYLAGRESGPIFITKNGRRMDEPSAWRMVRRLARKAEIAAAERINPHSLRHSFVTAALDAGVSLRDAQDAAGHADPRTTRRYDRARHNLDRHATYAVTAFLAGDDDRKGSDEL
jgi:site-specific recombinase XerD